MKCYSTFTEGEEKKVFFFFSFFPQAYTSVNEKKSRIASDVCSAVWHHVPISSETSKAAGALGSLNAHQVLHIYIYKHTYTCQR